MKRNEACAVLTKIAQNELIDMQVSREILKARDIVICEPNKVLDVLASPQTKEMYKNQLIEYISRIVDDNIYSPEIRTILYRLRNVLERDSFEDCTVMFLTQRCQSCPYFKGFSEA